MARWRARLLLQEREDAWIETALGSTPAVGGEERERGGGWTGAARWRRWSWDGMFPMEVWCFLGSVAGGAVCARAPCTAGRGPAACISPSLLASCLEGVNGVQQHRGWLESWLCSGCKAPDLQALQQLKDGGWDGLVRPALPARCRVSEQAPPAAHGGVPGRAARALPPACSLCAANSPQDAL